MNVFHYKNIAMRSIVIRLQNLSWRLPYQMFYLNLGFENNEIILNSSIRYVLLNIKI